jgi:hypothetical protein
MPEETAILVSRNSREVRIPEGMRSAQRPRGEAGMGDAKQAGSQRTRVPGAADDALSNAHVVIRPVPRIKPSRPPPALVEALKARQKSAAPSSSSVFKNRGLDLSERINRLRESNAALTRNIQAIEAERPRVSDKRRLTNEAHQLATVELRADGKAITSGRKR